MGSAEYMVVYAMFREAYYRRAGSMDFPGLIASGAVLAQRFGMLWRTPDQVGLAARNVMLLYEQRLEARFGHPSTWSLPQSNLDWYPPAMDPESFASASLSSPETPAASARWEQEVAIRQGTSA